MDDFSVPASGLQKSVARHVGGGRLADRRAGQEIGQDRQAYQHDCASQSRDPDPEMEKKADTEIKRHPGQVEKGRGAIAREEAAHIVEIAQRLQPVAGHPREER